MSLVILESIYTKTAPIFCQDFLKCVVNQGILVSLLNLGLYIRSRKELCGALATCLAIVLLYPLHFANIKQHKDHLHSSASSSPSSSISESALAWLLPFRIIWASGFGCYDGLLSHAAQKVSGFLLFRVFKNFLENWFNLKKANYLSSFIIGFLSGGLATTLTIPLATVNVENIHNISSMSKTNNSSSFFNLFNTWQSSLFVVVGISLHNLFMVIWRRNIKVIEYFSLSTKYSNLEKSIEYGLFKVLSIVFTYPFTMMRTLDIISNAEGNHLTRECKKSDSCQHLPSFPETQADGGVSQTERRDSPRSETRQETGFALLYLIFNETGFAGLYNGYWTKAIEHLLIASLTQFFEGLIYLKLQLPVKYLGTSSLSLLQKKSILNKS